MDSTDVITHPTALRTVLVVDDEPTVLATMRVLLGERGHAIVTAESGAAALTLLDRHGFDVALVDLHMPAMNGVEVCRMLRAHALQRGRSLRVWMMTAAHTREAEKLCLEAGAVAVLKKPFDWRALAEQIELAGAAAAPASAAAAPALTHAA